MTNPGMTLSNQKTQIEVNGLLGITEKLHENRFALGDIKVLGRRTISLVAWVMSC